MKKLKANIFIDNKIMIGVIIFTIMLVITSCCININRHTDTTVNNKVNVLENKNYKDLLKKIDNLQAQYFNNENIFNIEEKISYIDYETKRKNLFDIAKSYVQNNNSWLILLTEIDKNFQVDYNGDYYNFDKREILSLYNKEIQNLLSEIYKKIKLTIPKEDYVYLEKSQNKWENDKNNFLNKLIKCEKYNGDCGNGFDMIVGNIEYELYKFRILLLITYLQ